MNPDLSQPKTGAEGPPADAPAGSPATNPSGLPVGQPATRAERRRAEEPSRRRPAPVTAAIPVVAKPVPAKPVPAKPVPAKPVAASPVVASPVQTSTPPRALADKPEKPENLDAKPHEEPDETQKPVLHPAVPRIVAGCVALVGLLLVVIGALQATVFAPPVVTTATLKNVKTSVVSTAVGVLGLEGPRLEISATGGTKPVFLGIGRAGDVDAYLAAVKRQEVTGYDGDKTLLTRTEGTQAALPDPANADVWVVSNRGVGQADLVWPDAPGQWRLVAATDGTAAAPVDVTFTWSGQEHHSNAPALIAVGIVLLIGGGITVLMLTSRAGLIHDDGLIHDEEPV